MRAQQSTSHDGLISSQKTGGEKAKNKYINKEKLEKLWYKYKGVNVICTFFEKIALLSNPKTIAL